MSYQVARKFHDCFQDVEDPRVKGRTTHSLHSILLNVVCATIGYIVIESGAGPIGGISCVAGLGRDTVEGVTDGNGFTYNIRHLDHAEFAVVSAAGMDGGNGGWPVLYGSTPVTDNTLLLGFDEDQRDSERAHTTEQVAYIVSDPPPAAAPASEITMDASGDGQVTSMDALLVINWLNTHPSGATPSHLDLNHDGAVTPLDALVTINQRTRSVIQARAAINAQAIDQHWAFDDEDDSEGWLDEELLELMVP
ncbi:Dockerin type I repeat protein [Novipirellula artificiosorum]|uniref:Dockerin type I repeat protein n=2 Tax=Novipirellula artificiosorum TaxID=2528016 RepID=A0A5C6D7Q4_9BACT|nr:Dockerin type I repeat protein [Novipirellula artificiosorum]